MSTSEPTSPAREHDRGGAEHAPSAAGARALDALERMRRALDRLSDLERLAPAPKQPSPAPDSADDAMPAAAPVATRDASSAVAPIDAPTATDAPASDVDAPSREGGLAAAAAEPAVGPADPLVDEAMRAFEDAASATPPRRAPSAAGGRPAPPPASPIDDAPTSTALPELASELVDDAMAAFDAVIDETSAPIAPSTPTTDGAAPAGAPFDASVEIASALAADEATEAIGEPPADVVPAEDVAAEPISEAPAAAMPVDADLAAATAAAVEESPVDTAPAEAIVESPVNAAAAEASAPEPPAVAPAAATPVDDDIAEAMADAGDEAAADAAPVEAVIEEMLAAQPSPAAVEPEEADALHPGEVVADEPEAAVAVDAGGAGGGNLDEAAMLSAIAALMPVGASGASERAAAPVAPETSAETMPDARATSADEPIASAEGEADSPPADGGVRRPTGSEAPVRRDPVLAEIDHEIAGGIDQLLDADYEAVAAVLKEAFEPDALSVSEDRVAKGLAGGGMAALSSMMSDGGFVCSDDGSAVAPPPAAAEASDVDDGDEEVPDDSWAAAFVETTAEAKSTAESDTPSPVPAGGALPTSPGAGTAPSLDDLGEVVAPEVEAALAAASAQAEAGRRRHLELAAAVLSSLRRFEPPMVAVLRVANAPLRRVPERYRPIVDWVALSLVFWVPVVWFAAFFVL